MKRMIEDFQQRIGLCGTFQQLRALRDLLQQELRDRLLFSNIADWNEAVNLIHDSVIRQTVILAEKLVQARTSAKPPGQYAFVLFGSGGRSEQTLWSDQDNGLIYHSKDSQSDAYYLQLSEKIEEGLKIVGYPPCEGNVVAANDLWRKPIDDWETMISGWFRDASWENVRHLLIVADIRCLYGNEALVDRLKASFESLTAETPGILDGMIRNTLRHKVVLGPFGNLIREQYGEESGGFDVKYGAYIPMVNAIRLLAIRHQIRSASTLERIEQLKSLLGEPYMDKLRLAFLTVLWLRSMTPYQLTDDGYHETRGKLRAQDMTKEVVSKLKESLRVGEQLQKYIKEKKFG